MHMKSDLCAVDSSTSQLTRFSDLIAERILDA
jgi:hypothetical protein